MSQDSKYDIDIFLYENYDYGSIKTQLNYNHSFVNNCGLNFLTVIDCYQKHQYDYYMFFEEDLIYNSTENLFDKIFDSFSNKEVIFQDQRILDYNWYWFTEKNLSNINYKPYRGLLNIYVLKSNVIEDLLNFIKEGYWGHHEYLINSFILENNYNIDYLSNIFKIKCDFQKLEGKFSDYDLIHPIKSMEEYYSKVKKICIQTLVLNEQEYIKEWVDYHLKLGFDDIFIFEDFGSKTHKELFKGYENVHIQSIEEIEEITEYNSCKGQMQTMDYFLNKLKKENIYGWCLFIDIDEFLILETTLPKLLSEYFNYPGIWLSWKLYNSGGHIKKPEGKIMDNYTNIVNNILDNRNMWNKKSFVNIEKAESFKNNHIIKDGVDIYFNIDYNAERIFKKAWLNHYFSKSWEEYVSRMIRGNLGNSYRSFDSFFNQNPELKQFENELINSIRYTIKADVQYISRKKRLIFGGNLNTIKKLNNE